MQATATHTPCDAGTSDPFNAIGLGCAGELQISPSIDAHEDGMGIRTSFGATAAYDPREPQDEQAADSSRRLAANW